MDYNTLLEAAGRFEKMAQPTITQTTAEDYQKALYKGGNLIGLKKWPAPGEGAELNPNAPVFLKVINPILDETGINSININITVAPNLSVQILSDNKKFQGHRLLKQLQQRMFRVLAVAFKSKKFKKVDVPLSWKWLINYG